jgi:hypothetical protein
LIALAVVVILMRPVVSISLQLPKDYNEGYYAYTAARVLGPGNLYPESGSLIANGYTPLFAYVTGIFGEILDDHLVAGRWIALASFLFVAVGVGAVVRLLSNNWAVSILAGLTFIGYIGLKHPSYIGMNDPQWLAQAFIIAALFVYLKTENQHRVSIPVVALLLAAGLTKQTSVALPIALAVHIIWHCRDTIPAWAGGAAVAILPSVAALYAFHGPDFLRGVLFNEAQREYSVPKVLDTALDFARFFVPLLVGFGLFLWLVPRSAAKHLLLAYVASSAAIGFALTGGQFVGWNHLYDLLIALTITAGLAIAALSERLASRVPKVLTSILCGILANLALLAAAPSALAKAGTVLSALADRQVLVAGTISRIATVDGPVFCETMALCYWAGKDLEIDILELRRRLMSGSMSKEEFERLLASGHFQLLQFHSDGASGRTRRLPSWANDLILNHYEPQANEMGGSFLIPRRAM